jgi:hypothetical protein
MKNGSLLFRRSCLRPINILILFLLPQIVSAQRPNGNPEETIPVIKTK